MASNFWWNFSSKTQSIAYNDGKWNTITNVRWLLLLFSFSTMCLCIVYMGCTLEDINLSFTWLIIVPLNLLSFSISIMDVKSFTVSLSNIVYCVFLYCTTYSVFVLWFCFSFLCISFWFRIEALSLLFSNIFLQVQTNVYALSVCECVYLLWDTLSCADFSNLLLSLLQLEIFFCLMDEIALKQSWFTGLRFGFSSEFPIHYTNRCIHSEIVLLCEFFLYIFMYRHKHHAMFERIHIK